MDTETFLYIPYSKLEGLTQIKSTNWSKYFLGHRNMSPKTLETVSKKLDMTVEALRGAITVRSARQARELELRRVALDTLVQKK
jgi:hypothetical protein